MDGYVSKALRKKRVFRCAISNGRVEDGASVREVEAWNKEEAEKEYRRRMRGAVHWLDPVMTTEVNEA